MKKRLVLLWLVCTVAALPQKRDRERPPEPRREAELTLRVIEATSTASAPNDAADMVPPELKTILRFTRYHLLDSAFVRGVERENLRITIAGNLVARIRFSVRATPAQLLDYEIEINSPPSERDLLETSATGKSGETVVLGASRMRDSANALIVLLTGKLLPSAPAD